MAAVRTRGSASWPTRNRRLRLIRTIATAASSTPTRIDPAASGTGDPVSWWAARPAAAMSRPASAAESSANTARRVGSEVARTCSMRSRSSDSASGLACRTDCRKETPSRTKETASTTYPTAKWLGRLGRDEFLDAVRRRTPRRRPRTVRARRTATRHKPPGRDRTGARGRAAGETAGWRSAGRPRCQCPPRNAPPRPAATPTRSARRRPTSPPRSSTLTPKATRTVVRLSDPPESFGSRHRPEQVMGSAAGSRGGGGWRSLLVVLPVRHQPVLTHPPLTREARVT